MFSFYCPSSPIPLIALVVHVVLQEIRLTAAPVLGQRQAAQPREGAI